MAQAQNVSSRWLGTAGLVGAIGVALGAFGAHGLKDRISADLLEVYRTGVLYHLLHAVALLAVVLAGNQVVWARIVRWLLLLGIFVFSGTLYALALSGQRWLGAITPLGGLAFIAAWAAVFVGAATSRHVR